jgi:hypothetical protein
MNDIFIKRVKLLMEYDLSKTYNENFIISEQNPNLLYPTNMTVPKDTTMTSDMYGRQRYSTAKTDIGYDDSPINVGDIDKHTILTILSIGALFIPFVGPEISLGLSLAFDLGNSALYFSEDNTYEGGLMLAFSVIPGHDLLKLVPGYKKFTSVALKNLFKKLANKTGVVTKMEQELIDDIAKNSNKIKLLATKYLQKLLWKQMFKKMSLRNTVLYMWYWVKTHPTKSNLFKTVVIKIGGVWYTYEQLAEYFGIKPKTEEIGLPKNEQKVESQYNQNKDENIEKTVNMLFNSIDNMTQEQLDSTLNASLEQIKKKNYK